MDPGAANSSPRAEPSAAPKAPPADALSADPKVPSAASLSGEPNPPDASSRGVRPGPVSWRWFESDRGIALLLLVIVFLCAAPGVLRYGLSWDEPTYFHFAQMQRGWVGDLLSAFVHPSRFSAVFAPDTITKVWLQHPEANGHPPLNEFWMAMAGLPFHWAGEPDLATFRLAITLLLAGTSCLLFLLLRAGHSRAASLAGVFVYLGVPAVWAHGHFGATETMQNLFWVLLALLLPRALDEETGGRQWVLAWLGACALSFTAKFTNVLIPVWVLGTAGILGSWRRRRFWMCAGLGVFIAPLFLMILDPFFWPWEGGLARFTDYLRQATTRSQWVPINVFYQGRSWGFHPPWHYRPVMTAATLPIAALLLVLPGLYFAGRALYGRLRNVWRHPLAPEAGTGLAAVWPQALGITGFLYAWIVGLLPGTPNHDGTRQFVYIFVAVALLAAAGAEGLIDPIARFAPSRLRNARAAATALLLLALISTGDSLIQEPWGLSYYSGWLGGARGAWRKGFELTYWVDSLTPKLVAECLRIPAKNGQPLMVHTIPKLNYFADAEPFIRALLPAGDWSRQPLAKDDYSAYYSGWAAPYRAEGKRAAVLGLSFAGPADAILVSYRRATVADGLWDFLAGLSKRGEIVLRGEVDYQGVPLARVYQVPETVSTRLPEDPDKRTWYELPTIYRYEEQLKAASPR